MLTLLRLQTDYPDSSPGEGGFPLPAGYHSKCRLATGRSALFHLAKRLPEPHAHTVLLPCYVAEGVIKPFLAAGFRIVFYPLTTDLRPDERVIETLLRGISDKAVFVMVHYFGFSAASLTLSALLRQFDTWVVSDCAHAPLSRAPDGTSLGETGDFALYSLNKWMPVCDGAILLSFSRDISVAIDDDCLPLLPNEAREAFGAHLAACRALFNADNIRAMNSLEEIGASYESYYKIINNDMAPHRQSDESRRVENVFPYRTSERIRRGHADRLMRELRSDVFKPVHASLPLGVVPFCIPVRVPQRRHTELKNALFDRGILLSTLDDKWDFVPAAQTYRFPIERDFLKEHLLIPVSEFLSDADMTNLISELNNIQ